MNSQRSRDLNELKRQALDFYAANADVPKKIEDALNSLFYDSPYDIYGYLSEYFVRYSKPPIISRINARKSIFYDAKCQPTFRLDLFCQEKNKESRVLSIDSSCYAIDQVNDSARIQIIQEDDLHRSSKINEIINFINTEVNELIKNYTPYDQEEIDDKLSQLFLEKQTNCLRNLLTSVSLKDVSSSQIDPLEGKKSKTPTSPKQKNKKDAARKASQAGGVANGTASSVFGDEITLFFNTNFYASFIESLISKSVCLSYAILSKCQVFERIAQLDTNTEKTSRFTIPIPIVTLIQNGKGFHGKQTLIKEFMIMPKPNTPVQEGIDMISKVNRYIRDTLYQSKTLPGGVNKCVTDQGSFSCTLDSPHQGIDIIEAALTATGADANIAINISASELYDHEKAKYEIGVGSLKSSDELIETYIDLLTKYPRISMIIEPFLNSDEISWYKLHSRVSSNCLIANNIKINDTFSNFDNINDSNEAALNGITNPNSNNNTARLLETERSVDTNGKLPTEINNKLPEVMRPPNSLVMPVNFYRYENTVTVVGINKKINELKQRNLMTGFCCSNNETDDTFLTDLSVGNQVNFLKVGGFNRSERVNKLNRLIELEKYCQDNNILISAKDRSADLDLNTGFEVPPAHAEAISVYLQNIEDQKNQKNHKK